MDRAYIILSGATSTYEVTRLRYVQQLLWPLLMVTGSIAYNKCDCCTSRLGLPLTLCAVVTTS
jgi:hypothetical protein